MLTHRDDLRLEGVHPTLAMKVAQIINAMETLGLPMGVTDGVRTTAQQQALYAQGRTKQPDGTWVKTGSTVTNCDGVLKPSNHQAKADGFGHACDLAFINDLNADGLVELNEPFTWDAHRAWALYGAMAEAVGLVWGGRWQSIVDLPHVELPA